MFLLHSDRLPESFLFQEPTVLLEPLISPPEPFLFQEPAVLPEPLINPLELLLFKKIQYKIKNILIQKIMTINRYFPVIKPEKNNQLWEALKFLLILLLILLIATPQLVLAVLLLILMGAIMEMIRILSLSTSSGRRLGWQK